MAFNGSGTFNLPTGNPVVINTTVDATVHNNTNSEIATALSNCVTRDGQSPPTGSLPMAGFKLTGLGAGTGNGESVRYEQVGALAAAQLTSDVVFKTSSTGASYIPAGTDAQAPTGATGLFRFNSTLNKFVGWINNAWQAVGGGATGGGTDAWAVEVDSVVTQDWTVGLGDYTTGVTLGTGNNLNLTGHAFVIGSKVHFIAGSGSLGSVLTTDTVYYVVAISAGVSFQVSLTQGGGAVTPTGASNCSVAKLKNALTGASLDIANGVTVTIPNGTYLTLAG